MARKSALSSKLKENNLIIVEDFQFDTPNTKNYINVLTNLGVNEKKSLLVFGESNNNVYLSSRNLKASKVITVSELNTYGILNTNKLVLSESSLALIEENLSK